MEVKDAISLMILFATFVIYHASAITPRTSKNPPQGSPAAGGFLTLHAQKGNPSS